MADTSDNAVTAGLIVIGDEILSGRTKDENIGYMADHLTSIGIQLSEVRVIGDVKAMIIETVNEMRGRYTYVFTTGGIGPTHDDITAVSIAEAFGVPIDIDERAVALMTARYKKDEFTESRRRMARIPEGADLIVNAISAAPGFWLENVLVMAGIPGVMQVMLDDVTPKLKKGRKMLSATLRISKAESVVADALERHQDVYPDVCMGSYPYYQTGSFGTHLVLRCVDETRLREAEATLRERLGDLGLDDIALTEFSL